MGGASNWAIATVMLVVVFLVDLLAYRGIKIDEWLEKQNLPFRYAVFLGALFVVLIFGMYGFGYDATSFIYEGF